MKKLGNITSFKSRSPAKHKTSLVKNMVAKPVNQKSSLKNGCSALAHIRRVITDKRIPQALQDLVIQCELAHRN